MQAARMREIMSEKAGLQYPDDNIYDDDLGEAFDALAIGGRRRKAKVSKKQQSAWQPFLKKALAKRGKTMADYMNNKALRTQISADYKRKKAKGGAMIGGCMDDYEYDNHMTALGSGKKKYKAEKKVARKAVDVQDGVQVCTSNHWLLGTNGEVVTSACNKKTNVDPNKPWTVKNRNTFSYQDDFGNVGKIPFTKLQQSKTSELKAAAKAAKDKGNWPVTANIDRPRTNGVNANQLLALAMGDGSPLGEAAKYAYVRGDTQRLEQIKRQLVMKAVTKDIAPEGSFKVAGPQADSTMLYLDKNLNDNLIKK